MSKKPKAIALTLAEWNEIELALFDKSALLDERRLGQSRQRNKLQALANKIRSHLGSER